MVARVSNRVSNGTGQCNFLRQRNRSSLIVQGQRDKLKILPRDGTVWDSQNPGRDGPGQPNSGTGHRTKRDRAEKGCSKTEKDVLKQENDVLKQENDVLKQEYDVLKQEMWSFF